MTKKQRNANKRSSFCCFAAFQFEKVRYDQDMLTCCQANVAGHRDSILVLIAEQCMHWCQQFTLSWDGTGFSSLPRGWACLCCSRLSSSMRIRSSSLYSSLYRQPHASLSGSRLLKSCLSAPKLSSAFGNLAVRPGITGSYSVDKTWGISVYILGHEVPPPSFLIGGLKKHGTNSL